LRVENLSIIFDPSRLISLISTPKHAMPKSSLSPLSSRRRRKRIKALVSAAVSIDEQLYTQALRMAEANHDGNFSHYMRTLLKRDLGLAA
jgi:hypothetical protein